MQQGHLPQQGVDANAAVLQVLQELGFDASTCALVCQQVRALFRASGIGRPGRFPFAFENLYC